MTDIEIANSVKLKSINVIAKKLGLKNKNLEFFGNDKAKICSYKKRATKQKLVLVTAINPTSSGNGKTTVAIGLADALKLKKQSVCLALREPSLGPVFGMKGGATGGGQSQIVPMIDINLHFTGDFHAITSANNLLCAQIDNHIFQGNELDIKKVYFNRTVDLNDRALREIIVSKSNNATPRNDSFVITAASEIMAILCLSSDINDLKTRLGNITIGENSKGNLITAHDLKCENAMAILLKDAIKPNLVQTLCGTPCIVHGGPFANIAHGCNSIIATKTAMDLADYTITEAGFGADLGAEKFFDIKCRLSNIKPSCVVLVATIKALKLHGLANKNELNKPDLQAVKNGLSNLIHHIDMLKNVFNVPLCVTLNTFSSDTNEEIEIVRNAVKEKHCEFAENDVWAKGAYGALELADKVTKLSNTKYDFNFCYELNERLIQKIEKISKNVYGAKNVIFSDEAKASIKQIEKLGFSEYPICMAKTQYSISDDAKKLGAPKDFDITVRSIELKTGAKFITVILGDMLLMPGLSKKPALINMTIDDKNNITGIF